MPFDQNQLPTWNKEGVEPPQSLKDNGWQPSQKPPADYFNWFFNKVYNALKNLFNNAQHKEEKGQPNGYASLDANRQVPATQLPVATTTTQGAMSAADKAKLDGIESGAQRNTVTSVNNKTGAVTLTASDVGASPTGHTHTFTEITGKPTTLSGYGITDAETPTGAQAKANQAETNAKTYADQQLAAHSAETASKFTNINLNIIDIAVELETLKGATLNGVTANIFIETFTNLNDINLMNGVYDSVNKRLVL